MTSRSDPYLEQSALNGGGTEEQLRLTLRTRPDGLGEVSASGEIDFATHRLLLRALMDQLDQGRHRLLLDMRDVTFCDSTGLGVLIRVQQRAAAAGGWLRLVAPVPAVRRALEITNLDRLIPAYATTAEAVAD